MSVILPGALPSAAGWALADYRTLRARTGPAAGGIATVTLEQLAGDQMWLIDHAVVACTSSTPTEVRWYETTPADVGLLDGTARGNFDVADWPNGLQLIPSQSLVVQWTGASDGAVGTVTLQYRLMRRRI